MRRDGMNPLGSGVVLVASSSRCDAAVKDLSAGLKTFLDLVRQVPRKTRGGGGSGDRKRVPLRFCDVHGLHSTSVAEVDKSTLAAVRNVPREDGVGTGGTDNSTLLAFEALKDQLDVFQGPAECGFFDQPVCFLFVTLISDLEPVTSLSVLAEGVSAALPEAYKLSIHDSTEASRMYVLIRRKDDPESVVNRALSSARAAFGARNVSVIELEASETVQIDHPLAVPVRVTSPTERLVDEISSRVVPAFLQERLTALTAYVERVRKGVRNTFKSLFRTPEKNRLGVLYQDGPNGPPTFLASSFESHVRLLADTFFLLGDYEQALVHYRLVAAEYKIMKAPLPYGATMEVSGLCVRLLGGPQREAADCLRSAIDSYVRAEAWLLALRASCELVQLCLSATAYESGAGAALRIVAALPVASAKQSQPGVGLGPGSGRLLLDVVSAVLLEVTSHCFRRTRPTPKKRKAMMYAFFAGEKYSVAGVHPHAASCFHACLSQIQGLHWDLLEDNLHALVAREESRLLHYDVAYEHLAALLKDSHAPATTQLRVVEDLFSIVRWWKNSKGEKGRETFEPPTLSFPLLDMESIEVGTVDDPLANRQLPEHWAALEDAALRMASSVPPEAWLELLEAAPVSCHAPQQKHGRPPKLLSPMASEEPSTQLYAVPGPCVAGEDVVLRVQMTNPMRVPVFVHNVRAIATVTTAEVPLPAQEATAEHANGDERERREELVEAEAIRFRMIPALSKAELDLVVRPHAPGDLQFHRVVWTFSHEANGTTVCPGMAALVRRGRRLNDSKLHRTSLQPVYAKDRSLSLEVLRPIPRISARFVPQATSSDDESDANGKTDALPIREGEMIRADLELENRGKETVHRVWWTLNLPDSVCVEELDQEHVSIAPGEVVRLCVWLRGNKGLGGGASERGSGAGDPVEVRAVILCCVLVDASRVLGRLARASLTLEVSPCVCAFPRFLRHNKVDTETEYLLGVEVEHGNSQSIDGFRVHAITVFSRGIWKASGLPPINLVEGADAAEVPQPVTVLQTNETATLFILLRRKHQEDDVQSKTSASTEDFSAESVTFGGVADKLLVEEDARHRATKHFMEREHVRTHDDEVAESLDVAKVVVRWSDFASASGEIYLPPLVPSEWIDDEDPSSRGKESASGRTAGGSQQERSSSLFSMRCEHAESVQANFERTRAPCTVPVDVFIRNRGVTRSVLDAHFSAIPASIADRSRGRFWSGDVSVSLHGVPPGAERRLRLRAILTSYATYDLSEISLTQFPLADTRKAPSVAEFVDKQESSVIIHR